MVDERLKHKHSNQKSHDRKELTREGWKDQTKVVDRYWKVNETVKKANNDRCELNAKQ